MTDQDPIIDQWSYFAHKVGVGDTSSPTGHGVYLAPTPIPNSERRRLASYREAARYLANNARYSLRATRDEKADHREYGDMTMIADRIRSGVLGDTTEIVIDGADTQLPDEPDLPEPPAPLAPDAPPSMAKVDAVRKARYEAAVEKAIEDWLADTEAQPFLRQRQTELREWAEDQVNLDAKMVEAETDAIGLGDGLYTLYPQPGEWPRLVVYEPDGYFPILVEHDDADFPSKLHFAWQYETIENGKTQQWWRRLTWELVDLTAERIIDAGRDGLQWGPLGRGEEIVTDDQGVRVVRVHPWQRDPAGQPLVDTVPDLLNDPTGNTTVSVPQRSTRTCAYSDMSWPWEQLGDRKLDDLTPEKARIDADRIDLGVDFIPVIHIPNTPASKSHFGVSSIGPIAQLADDMAQVDTDLMDAARLTAVPMFTVSGAKVPEQLHVQPGRGLGLGENGRMDVLDLSNGVTVLSAYRDSLSFLLGVNSRVPASMVGRVDASSATGISMLLDAAPFAQLIGTLRLPRQPKYDLLLKFAQRMAQVAGVLPPGPTPRARMRFGSFLPLDRGTVAEQVGKLLQAKAISTYTAVMLLMAAGFEIEDAKAEVERIQQEDYTGAESIAAATGSQALAAEHLGKDLPEKPTVRPPTVQLPVPKPGGGTEPPAAGG